MIHKLEDNRLLMASFKDIRWFFRNNDICGKIIKDIKPFELDYCIRNLEDLDDLLSSKTESAIATDGRVCIIFEDNTTLEVEFSGNGPVILGYNTADFSKYPEYDGSCYKLNTLFKHCLGRKIVKVKFKKTKNKMLFPCYKGIDMSAYDDGIKEICFMLDNKSFLSAGGWIDYFIFSHKLSRKNGDCALVAYTELLSELDCKYFPSLTSEIKVAIDIIKK